ncbi:reverse transcriptase domain-containing protein [Tanacetum coccineum]
MMYLTASTESISAALFAKREEEQVPIYFVSRVLNGAELNYPGLEKLILALVHAARRLQRYFQAHMITVLTNSPIKQTLSKPEKLGRVAKWEIELGEHDIVFPERGDVTPKDFLIEVPLEDNKKEAEKKEDTKPTKTELSSEWKLFTDGAASSNGSCVGLMLIDPEGKEYTYALRFGFETTNNEAEYKALLVGLQISQEMEITSLAIFVDSQLLVNQIKVLPKRSIEEKEILQVETKEGESWMSPIHEYLVSGLLSEDPKESRKIRVKAPQYKLIRGNLYRRSFYTLWILCVASPQTNDIIKEVHEGSYGFNVEPRSMVVRITKQGYYWPLMHRDAANVLQDYKKCKEQSAIRKVVESSAITAKSKWPFSHWGVNILGPFPTAPGGFKFLAIAIEHSTKWVEAKPLTVINIRTLLRNSQKDIPFSLTYGSEAIIPISKNDVAKGDRGRIKEVDKRRGSKEIASIEEAYYLSKLRRHHNKRSSHSIYKIGDFVLLLQNNTGSTQVWQGPHMISEVHGGGLYKIVDAFDHSLTQTTKSTILCKFYM